MNPIPLKLMKLPLLLAGFVIAGFVTLDAQQATPQPDLLDRRINLSIEAIPVAELPGVLNKALGQQLNLIVPPDASHIILPPLKLHQVTITELFEALQTASSPAGSAEPLYTFQATSGNVWIFKLMQPTAPAAGPIPGTSQVFALEPYLKNLKVEDITTAIQTVAEMAPGAEGRPNLKFHEETKLLIASGAPTVLQSIESVLTALATSVQSQKEKSVEAELEVARAQMQSQKIATNLRAEALEAENQSLRERMREFEAKNTELERELVRARAELDLAAGKAKDQPRPQ